MQGLKLSESTETVPSDNDSTSKSHEGKRTPKSKKLKSSKKDRLNPTRFQGQGVSFKAKLIGVEELNEARGDKLCQETITRLKAAVRSTGTHKQRIWFSISLEGIKIREDKSGLEPLYHHTVPQISFISQDVTDDRAFGYICSPIPDTYHFVAIKTEKTASQVVLTLRDLFQTVLDMKQKQSEAVDNEQREEDTPDGPLEVSTESAVEVTENSLEEVNSAPECPVSKEEPVPEPIPESTPNGQAISDLLDLQFEPNFQHLEESIAQMTLSLTSSRFQNSPSPELQTEATALQSKKEEEQEEVKVVEQETKSVQSVVDRYAVFEDLDSVPSIFEKPLFVETDVTDFPQDQSSKQPENIFTEETKVDNNSPPLPARENSSNNKSVDFSVLADLDPLGKNRPFVDKKDFFHDIKNPPKRVLKDLVGSSFDSSTNGVSIRRLESQNSFDLPPRIPPRANPFSCSSLPPSTPPPVLTMTSRCSDPVFPILPSPPLNRSPRQVSSLVGPQSPPIPIPPRRVSPLANEDSPLTMRRCPRVSSESDKSSPGTWGTFDDNFNETPSPLAKSKPSFVYPNKHLANERPKNPFSNIDDVNFKVNPGNPFTSPLHRLTPPPTPPVVTCDTSSSNVPSDVFAKSDVFNVNPEKPGSPKETQLLSPEEGSIFRRKQDPFADDDFFQAFNKK